MRRTGRLLALALALVLALSAAALAANVDYNVDNEKKNVHAASLKGESCVLNFDGDKLNVSYTDSRFTDGEMVLVLLLDTGKEVVEDSENVPTVALGQSTIQYIDQKNAVKAEAKDGTVTFSVYPERYTNAIVRIISANVDETVAAVKIDYTLGDVNGDGRINVEDVLITIAYSVHQDDEDPSKYIPKGNPYYKQAMNINGDKLNNGDERINIEDVLLILQLASQQ